MDAGIGVNKAGAKFRKIKRSHQSYDVLYCIKRPQELSFWGLWLNYFKLRTASSTAVLPDRTSNSCLIVLSL